MGADLPAFFDMFLEMLWIRDIVGLVVKGSAFGFVAALCSPATKGCRGPATAGRELDRAVGSAACRAACLAGLAILFINGAWFLLVYHAGPAFGPTVLTPPKDESVDPEFHVSDRE